MSLSICEIFGNTVQGEGPLAGISATFIRLSGCSLKCKFCDTLYAKKEGKEMPVEDILNEVNKYESEIVVITGGEPLEQNIDDLVKLLLKHNKNVQIETCGFFKPSEYMKQAYVTWVISPKLKSSGNKNTNVHEDFIDNINNYSLNNSWLKFVISDKNSFSEMEKALEQMKISKENLLVYLMPECKTSDEYTDKLPIIIDYIVNNSNKKYIFAISPRYHILAYGNKRGV